MKLWSEAFGHGEPIPVEFAFGKPDPTSHLALSSNRSPPLSWSDLPPGTRSLALICHDPDVPSRADDVNQEGRRIPADLPRIDFFHWILLDIAPSTTSLPAGIGGDGIVQRGKPGPVAGYGRRHGLNDYTAWFAGDDAMKGTWFGYDGPCPPWNDTIVHHYWFTLYALDVARAPVEGNVNGKDALAAIDKHVLARATTMGTYTIAADAVDRSTR